LRGSVFIAINQIKDGEWTDGRYNYSVDAELSGLAISKHIHEEIRFNGKDYIANRDFLLAAVKTTAYGKPFGREDEPWEEIIESDLAWRDYAGEYPSIEVVIRKRHYHLYDLLRGLANVYGVSCFVCGEKTYYKRQRDTMRGFGVTGHDELVSRLCQSCHRKFSKFHNRIHGHGVPHGDEKTGLLWLANIAQKQPAWLTRKAA